MSRFAFGEDNKRKKGNIHNAWQALLELGVSCAEDEAPAAVSGTVDPPLVLALRRREDGVALLDEMGVREDGRTRFGGQVGG